MYKDFGTYKITAESIISKNIEVYYKGIKLNSVVSIEIIPEILIRDFAEKLNGI